MLHNEFYLTEEWESEDNRLGCRIRFFADHAIFSGHFPGQPVVPGVCMMEMVRELLEQHSGRRLWLHRADQVKFLSPILPDSQPWMEIRWEMKEGPVWKVQAQLKEDKRVLFRLLGRFAVQEDREGKIA